MWLDALLSHVGLPLDDRNVGVLVCVLVCARLQPLAPLAHLSTLLTFRLTPFSFLGSRRSVVARRPGRGHPGDRRVCASNHQTDLKVFSHHVRWVPRCVDPADGGGGAGGAQCLCLEGRTFFFGGGGGANAAVSCAAPPSFLWLLACAWLLCVCTEMSVRGCVAWFCPHTRHLGTPIPHTSHPPSHPLAHAAIGPWNAR